MSKKSKQDELNKIAKSILEQKTCPELAKDATQLVFGDGNPDADVVFIGEAPGKNEDLQGLPFVGAAGKFLNEMLEMIGLKRSDIYITNIVKYRPPNNRDPLPEEKAAFLPFLVAQLKVIKPKIVATLGRHSMNCFLPDLSISVVHGQPKRIRVQSSEARNWNLAENQEPTTRTKPLSSNLQPLDLTPLVILPLFHPAAALYNGGMRQTLIDDFAKIPTILQKI